MVPSYTEGWATVAQAEGMLVVVEVPPRPVSPDSGDRRHGNEGGGLDGAAKVGELLGLVLAGNMRG
jgi:hypothetical protein